jgi:predicted Fe-Mo cluster-binding NifX family protein
MKIAVITEDGTTISRHFGRAPFYLVATVEDGQIIDRQLRDKVGHAHFAHEPHPAEPPGQLHGTSPAAQGRHALMAEALADCDVLICGGMGYGAYESIRARGIRPIVTDLESIDEAIMACVEGRLIDQVNRLH